MPYRLVKGTFALSYRSSRLVGSQPDGDSIWFKPDKPKLLSGVGGRSAEFNGGGFAQLRLEGIDALELHYPGKEHQHAGAAVAARDYLLKSAGFKEIEYAPDPEIPRHVRSSKPVEVRGYILTNAIDPYHRPVAFVFAGVNGAMDGSDIFLNVALLNRSLNAALMKAGQVYPAYYAARKGVGGLPVDLREHLTALAVDAWNDDKGLWPVDASRANPRVSGISDLRQLAIWPKLYRRLATYFHEGNKKLDGFVPWLRKESEDRDDEVWILPVGELANLHDIIRVQNGRIDMLYWPEEIVVVPR